MSITHAEHLKLKQYMANDVEQFITDGLQDWDIAAEGAVADAHDPADDDSIVYWLISLAGNLLWAATVFFPPAGALAGAAAAAKGGASAATKVASVLGATAGSDTVRKMVQDPPATDEAKKFLRDMIARKADELRRTFLDSADDWIAENLANFVTDEMLRAAHITPDSGQHLTDADVEQLMQSVREKGTLRAYTLEHFLFPGGDIKAGSLRTTLRKFMLRELNRALSDFNQQFRDWKSDRKDWVWQKIHDKYGYGIGWEAVYQPQPVIKDHKVVGYKSEFEQLQDDYAQKNPFQPNLRFHGVPVHLQGPQFLTMPPEMRKVFENLMGG
jgi:hypothetical protein